MLAACLQTRALACQREENLQEALEMAGAAIELGAELLVYPELFLSGFCYDGSKEKEPYLILDPFRHLAKDTGATVIGSIMAGDMNLGFALDRGRFATCSKIHPFGPEKEHFRGGRKIAPLDSRWGKIGLSICYDLRFPEVARSLTLQGADMLVSIAQFPEKRIAHWKALVVARAIENQIHHIACNSCGGDAGGCSMIAGPSGEVIASAGSSGGIIMGEIDLAAREQARAEIPCLLDRRPDLYDP
ncbi:MAG: nitrilase [Methanotrichaceae archaeon]|nr:nitrilase [Methanotrichaceae archaeon]